MLLMQSGSIKPGVDKLGPRAILHFLGALRATLWKYQELKLAFLVIIVKDRMQQKTYASSHVATRFKP